MAHRSFLPIEDVPLVGGLLCLDFVNTNGRRDSHHPRERLTSLRDVLVFAERTGLVAQGRGANVGQKMRSHKAAAALSQVRDVRESLYRILRAVVDHTSPTDADLHVFNEELGKAVRHRKLAWATGGPRWTWSPDAAGVDALLAPILISASGLLEHVKDVNLKKCGECDWLFVDSTRNHSRRWCKATCGDRVKARRYYRRHKARGGD